jgi:hypothetical protein
MRERTLDTAVFPNQELQQPKISEIRAFEILYCGEIPDSADELASLGVYLRQTRQPAGEGYSRTGRGGEVEHISNDVYEQEQRRASPEVWLLSDAEQEAAIQTINARSVDELPAQQAELLKSFAGDIPESALPVLREITCRKLALSNDINDRARQLRSVWAGSRRALMLPPDSRASTQAPRRGYTPLRRSVQQGSEVGPGNAYHSNSTHRDDAIRSPHELAETAPQASRLKRLLRAGRTIASVFARLRPAR